MGSSERNQLPLFIGQEVFDTWVIGDLPTKDPLDVDLGDGRGNRRKAADNRDFPAIARQMHEIEQQRRKEASSILFRMRQMGDAGLRAAMKHLKDEKLAD
ncbi:MAG: hypothetical protein JWM07_643 [Candidatus Saccharibacteria bacterium]|nr:hypothetical protein [Candidatus Saccharibacteria bacterium]